MHPPAQVLPVFAVAYTAQHLGVCGGRTMTLHGVRGTDRFFCVCVFIKCLRVLTVIRARAGAVLALLCSRAPQRTRATPGLQSRLRYS